MECEQGFRPAQSRRQPTVLLLELLELRIDSRRLPPTRLRHQPGLALLTPRAQVRGVEPLRPQELSQLAVPSTGVCPPEDVQLVGGRKAPTRVARGNFGIRNNGHDVGLECGRPSAPGRLASLVAPVLRLSHTRLGGHDRTDLAHQCPDTSPPSTLIAGAVSVSAILAVRVDHRETWPKPEGLVFREGVYTPVMEYGRERDGWGHATLVRHVLPGERDDVSLRRETVCSLADFRKLLDLSCRKLAVRDEAS